MIFVFGFVLGVLTAGCGLGAAVWYKARHKKETPELTEEQRRKQDEFIRDLRAIMAYDGTDHGRP